VNGPFVTIPSDVYEQEKLSCLCYESLREKLAERFHCAEDFLELLNPDVKFSELAAGATIIVPNVRPPFTNDQHDFARVVISIVGNSFNAFDAGDNLIFHAPQPSDRSTTLRPTTIRSCITRCRTGSRTRI
jgi:hypothetical protein